MSPTATNLVTLLRQRGTLLAQLVEAPTDVPTLTEEVSVSRSTVNRALESFEEWGLIATDTDRLEPTLSARLVLMVYDDFETDVETMVAHEPGDAPLWRTTAERIDALALVADRLDLLEYVQTPREKRTLVTERSAARSTINRAIRELEGAGLIQRTTAGYTTTPIGQRITARYRTLLATLTELLDVRDLLAHLPSDCALPPTLCTGTTIERASETTPYRLLAGVRERLDTADRIQAVLPALAKPQLLDVCHHRVVRHGATLELITDPALAETLTSEFPGPLAEMAAAAAGTFTASVTDTPPFGLVLADTDAGPSVSLLVYSDNQTVKGAFHAATDAALAWAEDYYEHVQSHATETTTDWVDAAAPTGEVALAAVADPGRVEREAEGFVQLTAEYFANRATAPPATAWRTGFDLVDVHAGYAIDRLTAGDSEPTRQSLTDDLFTRLTDGTAHALIGAPGSGKSTVCKAVACRWYEQGKGAVFYRESETGVTFDSPALLSAQVRAAEGQTLVVVEDAVRAEANDIFRVMEDFRADATVTFLVDARTGEWDDPSAFPPDARLDVYRTETVETVPMPELDEDGCERLVQHFQETTDHEINVTGAHLLREIDTENANAKHQQAPADDPATLLLVLHRLTLHVDPLADDDARTPTTLAADVQRTYEKLHSASEVEFDVGVLVNLLNAAGIGVQPALVYALADDNTAITAVGDAFSSLEGQLIFAREEPTAEPHYRSIHEVWSTLFLEQVLDAATTDRAAGERFGRCVSALLALADDPTRHERLSAAIQGTASSIERINAAPTEWADAITERLFQLGLDHPKLASLFGTSESGTIVLPAACSPIMEPRCAQWRGEMYFESGSPDRAKRELEHAANLVETTEANDAAQLTDVHARSDRYLGALAHMKGELDCGKEFFEHALERYRSIDDRLGEADCHNLLGSVASLQGDLDYAEACCEQSLAIRREIGGPQTRRIKPLNNLGFIAARRGDLDTAEDYFERCVDIGRDLDEPFGLAQTLFNLGDVIRRGGDLDAAEEYCKEGIDLIRTIGNPHGNAKGYLCLGKIARDRTELDQAETYVQRSLETWRAVEDIRGRARAHRCLGHIARNRANTDIAEEHLTTALTLARKSDYRYAATQTLVELGNLARDQDKPERACEHFADAVDLFCEIGAVRDAVDGLERLAATCDALTHHDAARTHYETAIALVEETEFIDPSESLTERCAQLPDNAREADRD
jgi:tetratricopeptide (TPR) repeat protein/predicted transcriptional regulator/energy-coupling factor transporter ATP-binding protein EcfA2